MSGAEDDTCFLDRGLHPNAVFELGRHGFLAENMIALLGECKHNLEVHIVLDADQDRVGEAFTYGLDSVGGSLVQFLPCIEYQGLVD